MNNSADNKFFYIVNNKGDYFVGNDFNGHASFLPKNADGTMPITTFCRRKTEIENKFNYLWNHTDHPNNCSPKRFGKNINSFTELKIVEFTETSGLMYDQLNEK